MCVLMVLVVVLVFVLVVQVLVVEFQGDIGVYDLMLLVDGLYWFVFMIGCGIQWFEFIDVGRIWWCLVFVFSEVFVWWVDVVLEYKCLDVWVFKFFQYVGCIWVFYFILIFGKNWLVIGLVSSMLFEVVEWCDEGFVVQSWFGDDFNVIDFDLMCDCDGWLWMSYGFFWGGICLIEFDVIMLCLVGVICVIVCYKGGIEVLILVCYGDWVYFFVLYDLCCCGVVSIYNICVGCVYDVIGFFVDCDGVFLLDGGGMLIEVGGMCWKGFGYQDVVGDVSGDVIVCYVYDVEDGGKLYLCLNCFVWFVDGWFGI